MYICVYEAWKNGYKFRDMREKKFSFLKDAPVCVSVLMIDCKYSTRLSCTSSAPPLPAIAGARMTFSAPVPHWSFSISFHCRVPWKTSKKNKKKTDCQLHSFLPWHPHPSARSFLYSADKGRTGGLSIISAFYTTYHCLVSFYATVSISVFYTTVSIYHLGLLYHFLVSFVLGAPTVSIPFPSPFSSAFCLSGTCWVPILLFHRLFCSS